MADKVVPIPRSALHTIARPMADANKVEGDPQSTQTAAQSTREAATAAIERTSASNNQGMRIAFSKKTRRLAYCLREEFGDLAY